MRTPHSCRDSASGAGHFVALNPFLVEPFFSFFCAQFHGTRLCALTVSLVLARSSFMCLERERAVCRNQIRHCRHFSNLYLVGWFHFTVNLICAPPVHVGVLHLEQLPPGGAHGVRRTNDGTVIVSFSDLPGRFRRRKIEV